VDGIIKRLFLRKNMKKVELKDTPYETWRVSKPAISGVNGVVVAQEIEAATAGGKIIEEGGNAVDGAIAAAFALSVTEPWMSGLGGGGFMIVYLAAEEKVQVVDFGMIAPQSLDPEEYPLTGRSGADLFGWPEVAGDANFHGPKSIAVPGSVAGYGLAVDKFCNKSWEELISPAVSLAERGHRKTWWTTLNVAVEAKLLARYSQSKLDWLPEGFVPSVTSNNEHTYLKLDKLANTLRLLRENGPNYFYEGDFAQKLSMDVQTAGGKLSEKDLRDYSAQILDPITVARGNMIYNLAPGLTAGPTFVDALERTPSFKFEIPSANSHALIARALIDSYQNRFATMGFAGDAGDRSCTTNISSVDRNGNMAIITTTLLSRFGSRFVAPTSGVLMNNGINWFDPRPGRPNSIAAGKRPLSNMCPMIATRSGKAIFGLGASGGRKIMPAVFQLASYLNDFNMNLETALKQPRFDVSGINKIVFDPRFDPSIKAALEDVSIAEPWAPTVFPSMYAVPSGVQISDGGDLSGAAHIHSPLTGAVGI
jgi:gamma-glutamyltranspeptidase/glutathione hydrolase